MYHISWLETAIKNFKAQSNEVHTIENDMTIDEFIKLWASGEVDKIIKS